MNLRAVLLVLLVLVLLAGRVRSLGAGERLELSGGQSGQQSNVQVVHSLKLQLSRSSAQRRRLAVARGAQETTSSLRHLTSFSRRR